MVDTDALLDTVEVVGATGAPEDRTRELLDARELPPPEPLRGTLERLTELDDRTVLVQLNDRAPQHLYPQLDDREYEYETVEVDDVAAAGGVAETDDAVVTVIWRDA